MTIDRGIKAIWYDLAEAGRGDYLTWLHEIHFPEILNRPGYLWAAHYENAGGDPVVDEIEKIVARPAASEIGAGSNFLILIGAASPHVFFNPGADETAQRARAKNQEMAAFRTGTRTCIFTEEARVDGPEIALRAPGTTPGPAIQMGSFRTKTEADEFDLGAWYAQYRLPAMAAMPGCIAARKLTANAGWADHSVIYEFTSLEARRDHFQNHEALALDKTEWTNKIINYTIHAPGSPGVFQRLWPAP